MDISTRMKFFVLLFITSPFIINIQGQDVPTLVPVNPFDPNYDADQLFKAMDGWGTDENKIVSILCYRSASQRSTITTTYNSKHGSLADDLSSDLNGSFQTLAIMLTHDTAKFLSIELHETMARSGTDEVSLTEIVMSRTNQELADVRIAFIDYYGHSLASEIEGDTVRPYQTLLLQMAEGMRDESGVVDELLVQKDIVDLYEGGPAIEGTNEKLYIDIFTLRNFDHLNAVAIGFEQQYGASLTTVVVTEFANDMGNSMASILQYSRDKAAYFSSRFHTTIKGPGTEDRNLMRLTVSRCEVDLENIKQRYQKIYDTPLRSDVSDDTSGSYKDALLALIG